MVRRLQSSIFRLQAGKKPDFIYSFQHCKMQWFILCFSCRNHWKILKEWSWETNNLWITVNTIWMTIKIWFSTMDKIKSNKTFLKDHLVNIEIISLESHWFDYKTIFRVLWFWGRSSLNSSQWNHRRSGQKIPFSGRCFEWTFRFKPSFHDVDTSNDHFGPYGSCLLCW